MPELPEVETVCRGLAQMIQGKILVDMVIRRHDLRQPIPHDLPAQGIGKKLISITRRSKYILLHFDDPAEPAPDQATWIIIHLGMSGRILVTPPNPGQTNPGPADPPLLKHDHVMWIFSDQTRMVFNDPRRFGLMTWCAGSELASHPLLADLGPEPLGEDFTPTLLAQRLQNKKTPIKSALLDQTLVAGLGNIYVCEALFHAHIAPQRPAYLVSARDIKPLHTAIQKILRAAIDAGGSSWRDYAKPDGDLGYFQLMTKVYGREGEKCLGRNCNGVIMRQSQAGRSSFFCPQCQK
ncbi:MAG: bifunctional DNA-formamidopyrimidine glycosylase/DNA-(apurinic or apyrimidinic site) lyase [Candidatus Symbiobacter sp.]|nr:bifunctional DNA-formamidopyrimidine glycosylase/DNA-(apurinic or apyrimidinic site) lyase [Candidatus Symbiobacter sp.]